MSVYVCSLNTPIKSKLIAFNGILLNLKGITSNIFKQFILLIINICFIVPSNSANVENDYTKQLLISIRTQLQSILRRYPYNDFIVCRYSTVIIFNALIKMMFFIRQPMSVFLLMDLEAFSYIELLLSISSTLLLRWWLSRFTNVTDIFPFTLQFCLVFQALNPTSSSHLIQNQDLKLSNTSLLEYLLIKS